MSTTLNRQKDLEKVSRARFTWNNLKRKSGRFISHPQYLLVRHPCRRVESFFKDKLRKDLEGRVRNKRQLRNCHYIFFYLAGIDPRTDSLDDIKSKLFKINFEAFIRDLPRLYLEDGHLHPQYLLVRKNIFPGFPLHFDYDRILQIESKTDMAFLETGLGLKLGRKYNSSSKYDNEVAWNQALAEIVYEVYREDFAGFGYGKEF